MNFSDRPISVKHVLSHLLNAVLLCALAFSASSEVPAADEPSDCVILLHGMARTSASMSNMERVLSSHSFVVVNVDYPSRKKPIEELAPLAVGMGLEGCRGTDAVRIHFVTHSLGGILVRYYLAENTIEELGRVVMLAPPNKGSGAVDHMATVPGFAALNGPAGFQLGTDENSVPLKLGPANFEVGIITGNRSINPILSGFLENPDDGKVSVESAKLEGMTDFLVVPEPHPFIMSSDYVIEQTIHFLRFGKFPGNGAG
jgi:hypothetical protein